LAEKARELEMLEKAPEIKIEPTPKKEEVQIVVDGDKTESEADNTEELLQKSGIDVKQEFYQNQTSDLEKQIEDLKKKMAKQNEVERNEMLNEAYDI